MVPGILFSLQVIIIVLHSISQEARSQRLGLNCNNDYNPNGNSPFRGNLNFLLSSTLSNASRTKDFYNSTAGLNTSAPAYGLYMCRGDVTLDLCHSCVQNASRETLNICRNQTLASIWYDSCMLRYSNRSIISVLDQSSIWPSFNPQYVTPRELDGFNLALGEMMDEIATRAANSRSGKKFAVLEGNFSPFAKLYTLAQCTPDLSIDDCDTCLRDAISRIPTCCADRRGGRVLFPSCNIRYEINKFYNIADAPSLAPPPNGKGKSISVAMVIAIVVSIIVSVVLFVIGFLFLKKRSEEAYGVAADETDENDMSAVESIQYSFSEIQAATNNFSIDHKIGRGGFGVVYKGTLPNGQQVAVKRLSRTSVQGVEEFKNEILLVAKLQHRNLVRLLGFSFQGDEKILIYEFVPNKSLDYFLFDPEKQSMLDWSKRQKIIGGIARGLLYLHEDSRGYMPPEYAMHGQFSVKSDVYSFGVLVLEIISGKKIGNFNQYEDNLLSYAWKNWRDGTPLALLDPDRVGDSNYARNEILQCIHVGLLCVQEDIEQRPTMASVVLMLSSRSVTLAAPHHPAFVAHSQIETRPRMDLEESHKSSSKSETLITELYPR